MNRYYLLTLSGNRLQQAQSRLAPLAGWRELPPDIGHVRTSLDGKLAIIQGNPTDEDHAWFLSLMWVTPFADYAAVLDYLAANAAAWDRTP